MHPTHEKSMRFAKTLRLALAGLPLLALAACDDPAQPERLPDSQIVLVRADPAAPPLETMHVSFWARAGDTKHVEIRYESTDSYSGDKCVEFNIPSNGLYKRPDGSRIQKGDSVLITLDVVDAAHFDFRFAPSGLQFDPSHPAEIRISYKWAAADANGDGVVDARDQALLNSMAVWGREAEGQQWQRLSTDRDGDARELRARIPGFSQYAMAGGN
jgi:hypothetical protein